MEADKKRTVKILKIINSPVKRVSYEFPEWISRQDKDNLVGIGVIRKPGFDEQLVFILSGQINMDVWVLNAHTGGGWWSEIYFQPEPD